MKFRHHDRDEKIKLQMTAMIDVVFLLNIFFLCTFKIVLPEGDFNVQMPSAAAAQAADPTETLPLRLVLKAGPNGELADLLLAGRSFGTGGDAFARLQQHIRGIVGGGGPAAAEQEVELDCDYGLNYEYVVKAMTAVTGYIENGQRHKLIERIKFVPPKSQ